MAVLDFTMEEWQKGKHTMGPKGGSILSYNHKK